MYVNKYLLIALGLIIALVLALFQNLFFMMLWCLIFWSWYFSKPTIKRAINYPDNCNEDADCGDCIYVEDGIGCKLDKGDKDV